VIFYGRLSIRYGRSGRWIGGHFLFAWGDDVDTLRVMKKRFVYVISSEGGFCKVGTTANTKKRIGYLQCGTPLQLSLAFAIEGSVAMTTAAEKEIHKRLKQHRKRGEWFICSVEMAIDTVKKVFGQLLVDGLPEVEVRAVRRSRRDLSPQFVRPIQERPLKLTKDIVSGVHPGRPFSDLAYLTLEHTQPWITVGISRRTWYRRKARGIILLD
jgi:Meiotically up-regulated gene 113